MLARLSEAIGFRPSLAARKHRDRIVEICAGHGASEPRLFGSVARGEDDAESDLDLIVRAEQGMTMYDVIALEEELEALCGVPVDVVTEGAVTSAGRSLSDLGAEAV